MCIRTMAALLLLPVLSSCQTPARPVSTPVAAEPAAAEEAAEQAAETSRTLRCYELDTSASELRLLVYKSGPLARLGHNHVMVSHGLTGTLALAEPFRLSRARVILPVASLEVDPEVPRAEEGTAFASTVSDEARAGTRTNMLGAGVLDAEVFPEVQVELLSLAGPQWSADAKLRIRLRDQLREQVVAVSLLENAGVITAISSFSIRQTEFGMTQFSVLGGGLRVADELKVRINLKYVASTDGSHSCIAGITQTEVKGIGSSQ